MATNLIIEFHGLPGSGKSTVTGLVANELQFAEVRTSRPQSSVGIKAGRVKRHFHRVALVSTELALSPIASLRAAVSIIRSQRGTQDKLARSSTWLVVSGLIRAARRRPGVHLFDQGPLQELASIAYRGRRIPVHLISPRLSPDLLVYVDVPIDICAERLKHRAGSSSRVERDGEVRKAVGSFADIAQHRLDGWIQEYRNQSPVRVVYVANGVEDGGIAAAARVLSEIERVMAKDITVYIPTSDAYPSSSDASQIGRR